MIEKRLTTWILVCDGARARILENVGPGTGLVPVRSEEHPESLEKTGEMGTDRPGRTFDSAGQGRHAMAPPTDWHRFEKERFAHELAAIVNKAGQEGAFHRLVLVAPPQVLGELRRALDGPAADRIAGEMNKDLTHLELHDLAPRLECFVRL